jgi:hypothetical protein
MEHRTLSVRLPQDIYDKLTIEATRNLWSLNKVIIVACDKYTKLHAKKAQILTTEAMVAPNDKEAME